MGNQRQRPQANPGSVVNGIADGRGDGADRRFSGAGGGQVFTIDEDDVEVGDVAESWHGIARENRCVDPALGEADALEERATESLDRR